MFITRKRHDDEILDLHIRINKLESKLARYFHHLQSVLEEVRLLNQVNNIKQKVESDG